MDPSHDWLDVGWIFVRLARAVSQTGLGEEGHELASIRPGQNAERDFRAWMRKMLACENHFEFNALIHLHIGFRRCASLVQESWCAPTSQTHEWLKSVSRKGTNRTSTVCNAVRMRGER